MTPADTDKYGDLSGDGECVFVCLWACVTLTCEVQWREGGMQTVGAEVKGADT